MAALLWLALPAPAGAGQAARYAAPSGAFGGPCTQADPCDLRTAVDGAASGQGIRLEGGIYILGSQDLYIDASNDFAPIDPAQPASLVIGGPSSPATIFAEAGSSISDLGIRSQGGGTALVVSDSQADRVVTEAEGTARGCALYGESRLRDSLCTTTGIFGGLDVISTTGGTDATLRNVTAYGESGALGIYAEGGETTSLDARNSIFFSSDEAEADIAAFASGDGSAIAADIDSSNYDAVLELDDPGTSITLPQPGAGANQTAGPLFVDPGSGDFRQQAGSPTIDAGDSTASDLGATDLGGNPRLLGDAVDIGAYEAVDETRPVVRITGKPAERTRKRTATFRFTASDETTGRADLAVGCTLDGRAEPPCKSPRKYRGLKPGRHVFVVFATDEAGNISRGGRYAWKVVKKKRRAGR